MRELLGTGADARKKVPDRPCIEGTDLEYREIYLLLYSLISQFNAVHYFPSFFNIKKIKKGHFSLGLTENFSGSPVCVEF